MVATLSNNAIESRKLETLNAQALRRTVAMRDIEIIDDKTIFYNGVQISITKGAFTSLMKMALHVQVHLYLAHSIHLMAY
mgnify:CR=1 FL=1